MIKPVQASVSNAGAANNPTQKCSRQIRRSTAASPRRCARSTVTTIHLHVSTVSRADLFAPS
jgi:hypothetical protein